MNQTFLLNNALRFDSDILKGLLGVKLSSSDFMKIENTALADVIAEEPGNESFREDMGDPSTPNRKLYSV